MGMFLFAQLAVSAYACPDMAQAMQLAEMRAAGSDAMPPGCDQVDQKAANLCAEHCKVGQQSSDTAPVPVVMAAALALLYVLTDNTQTIEDAAAAVPARDPLLAATPPPHALLHCVLRI